MSTPSMTAGSRERTQPSPVPWWIFLVTGGAWIAVALLVLQFDPTSVGTIALLLGLGLLSAGLMEALQAVVLPGWRWLHAGLGLLFLAGGIATLAWPGETFLVLANLVGWYLLLKGTVDVVEAFAVRERDELWWMLLVLGIVEISLALWVAGYPGRKAALLVLWVGIAALARGISDIFLAFMARRAEEVTTVVAVGAEAVFAEEAVPRQPLREEERLRSRRPGDTPGDR